jgi:hypothetical protein
MKVQLGGPTRNTFKGQSRNKNWPNNIPGSFSLNVFIIINYSCLSIACQSIWLKVSIIIKKGGNHYKFVFLVDMAPLGFKFLNFGNS